MTITFTKAGKVSKTSLRRLLTQFQRGQVTKVQIERQLGRSNHKGKYITRLWASELGVDTRFNRVVTLGGEVRAAA